MTPVLGLDLWSWKETPDYREVIRRDVDIEAPMNYEQFDDVIAVWFDAAPATRLLQAGVAQVGVSGHDELVAIQASGLSRLSSQEAAWR